jgi:hypothetical protein
MRRKGVTRRGALGGALGTVIAGEAEARIGVTRFFGGGTAAVPPPLATPSSVNLTPSSSVVLNTASLPTTLCSIGVTMSDASTFTGSLTENGANTSLSGTNLRLDTMPADGLSGILVSATQNSVTASSTFNLTITAPGAGTNFVTGISSFGGVRSGNGSWMGMEITTQATGPTIPTEGVVFPLLVSALGRWMVAGNTNTHTLKIVDAATGLDVPNSTVSLNMSGHTPNAFAYATLATPAILDVFHTYYIVSSETGSDQLLDAGTVLTFTSDAFIYSGIDFGGSTWNRGGGYNTCNGPLNFVYTLGTHINVGAPMPAPNRNDHGPAAAFVMGGFGATLNSGTIVIDGDFVGNFPAVNSMVGQYMVDGQPASPYITGPVDSDTQAPNFPWTVNTATHPLFTNGTHQVLLRFVDSNPAMSPTTSAFRYRCYLKTLVVQNPLGSAVGDYSGSQVVPTGAITTTQVFGATSWLPDFITYPGSVPAVNSHPRPSFSVAPTSDIKYRGLGELYIEDMSSMKSQEFVRIPCWATTNKGGIYIDYSYPDTGGGSVEDFYPAHFRSPTRAGGRCSALTTPMSTFIADPRSGGDTGYIGITLQGGLYHLSYEGNVTLLAGLMWDQTKPGFDNVQTRDASNPSVFVDEDTVVEQCIVKAAITGFATEQFGGLNDLCYDPRDNNIIYLVNLIDSFIIKVDLHFDPPHCSVYAGQPGTSGYLNVAGTGAANALFHSPSSIIMCDGSVSGFPAGTMLVCDNQNSAIRRISPDGLTVTTLCGNQTSKPSTADLSNPSLNDTWSPSGGVSFTPGNDSSGAYVNFPFTIRFTSNQAVIIFWEWFTTCFRTINLTTNTITRIPNTKNGFFNFGVQGWGWFDVDTMGVLGPVDDFVTAGGAAGGGTVGSAPYSRGSLAGYVSGWIGDGIGRLPEGPGDQAGTVFAPIPTYGWVAAFSKTRSHFVGGGFRYYGLYAARPKAPSDPVININNRVGINIDVFDKVGSQNAGLWYNGTSMCFPLGSRPSFVCLYGELGNALLGSSIVPNFDDLVATYPTDGSFTAEVCATGTLGRYLQDGGAGQVPRPELTGNDLRAICYYIRRTSLSGTYPIAVEPGPLNPDTLKPRILSISAARVSNDSLGNPRLQVTWTTDKRTIGMAVAGSTAQQGTWSRYSCWSPIESAFGTSHTAIVTGCPAVSPLHYCAVVKDVAGNSVYSDDQTIT